ncbi:MAG: phosphoglycerate mutase, partial [Christensenellaceae bacterium]|nr:phosphoglycerate mutase [Christensenellaceae bacterium]
MKYFVLLGDGMADRGESTPLMVAKKPFIDALCKKGQTGLVQTIPDGFKPGSDVANLSVMGYAPELYYTGRSPLEALSIGVKLEDNDIAIRANLVTIENGILVDYSAGEIETADAVTLINEIKVKLPEKLKQSGFPDIVDSAKLYAGVSYRHCMVLDGNGEDYTKLELTPPHDITGKIARDYPPKGAFSGLLFALSLSSGAILKDSEINKKRIAEGKRPATNLWFWGAGKACKLKPFTELTREIFLQNYDIRAGLKGSVISAVDLLKGIAIGAEMSAPEVK